MRTHEKLRLMRVPRIAPVAYDLRSEIERRRDPLAKQFARIEPAHMEFIREQKIFFNASAAREGRVNVSPRDAACFRILDDHTVVWLDRTGSGNETAAHLRANGRLTVMFCAFEGSPMILRLYGSGRILRRGGAAYAALLASEFEGVEPPGARQMVRLDVDLVVTSCGFGVPLYDYRGERDTLPRWAAAKGEAGLQEYWREKNLRSLDGLPTGLLDEEKDLDIEE